MKYALVDERNKVVNIIEYDGQSPYTPPEGLSLAEVNDWLDVGDDIDKTPKVGVPPSREEIKAQRNSVFENDQAIKAAFRIEKRNSPKLTFSDYLDQLEAEEV